MLAKVFVGLTLASSAFANVFVCLISQFSWDNNLFRLYSQQITVPFDTTSLAAGQEATIEWQDDGSEPSLAEFGPAKFSIYTGNAQEQVSSTYSFSQVTNSFSLYVNDEKLDSLARNRYKRGCIPSVVSFFRPQCLHWP